MLINNAGSVNGYVSFRNSNFQSKTDYTANRSNSPVSGVSSLRQLLRDTFELRDAIKDMRKAFSTLTNRSNSTGNEILKIESNALTLDESQTATSLSSSEEINTTTTSFSPFGPAFNGNSTSEVTVGGVYSGNKDETLTFKVKRDRTVGENKSLQLDVLDGKGKRIDRINIAANTPADTAYTLNNGLTVSFSAGNLKKNDTFSVDVSASVGSAVDPTKSFNGVRNDQPNLQPGLSVNAGAFELNGVQIQVAADDSINSVVDKINQAGAGVAAAFNSQTERIDLVQQTLGSSGQIDLTNGSSGFLAAVKLNQTTPNAGKDPDSQTKIANVAAFSSVTSGTLVVNGQQIEIDVNRDTLETVVTKLNANSTDVQFEHDKSTDTLRATTRGSAVSLSIEDESSNFFTALGIETGKFEIAQFESEKKIGAVAKRYMLEKLETFTKSLNQVFEQANEQGAIAGALELGNLVRQVLGGFMENNNRSLRVGNSLTLGGIEFSSQEGKTDSISFNRTEFSRGLRSVDVAIIEMFGKDQQAGPNLLEKLDDMVSSQQTHIRESLFRLGERFVDTQA